MDWCYLPKMRRLSHFPASETAESRILSYLLLEPLTLISQARDPHSRDLHRRRKQTNWINEKGPWWFISCLVIKEPQRRRLGFFFSLDVFKWLCILTPAPPPTFLLSCSLSASWCNVRNSNHVRLWHWQPWHSQQRDTEEREEERLQRGEVRKSSQGRGLFFFLYIKSIAAKSPTSWIYHTEEN